ncbi:unnamed protein product [Vitrella brassicaformis CCMP3155]|uniref:Uncharacterized protein n=1 Tax=Vitrella brassicaformis (strain CCMP3155) TaxID=1169540 RepID=A0A0G4ELM8_VITBC|nr:unnamed protein product [Vitrella brassicaformis CCMP3155]|eukprot:CEL97872.1 unnamed protein product [Vitrella brassicaformis CCMP3155]
MPVLSKTGHLQLYTGRPSCMGSILMGRGPPKAQQTHLTNRSSVPMVVLGATGAQEALHAAQQTVQAMKTASAERLAKRTAVKERTRQSLKDKERAEYTRLIESNPKLLGGLSAGRPSAARKTRQNNKSTGVAVNGAVVGTRAVRRELPVDTAVPESSSARVSPSAALPLPPSPQQAVDHTAGSTGGRKEAGKAAGGSDGSPGVSSSYVRGDGYELRSEGFSRLKTVRPCQAAAAYMSRANAAIGQWAPKAVKVQRGGADEK